MNFLKKKHGFFFEETLTKTHEENLAIPKKHLKIFLKKTLNKFQKKPLKKLLNGFVKEMLNED